MDITPNNVNNALDNPSPETLKQIFSKLVDPTQGRTFLVKYTVRSFYIEIYLNSLSGWNSIEVSDQEH